MRYRYLSLALIVILLILQTGCWNSREINELAFVLSIALDKADGGFKVTAQIAKPEIYSKTSTGGGASDKEKPFWVISGNGKTIFEAVRNMAEISPRRIFWSHIKVIVLSEELAKNDILEVFDFFSRNPELRLRTWVAVTEGEAGKLLEIEPTMEKEPAQNIERILDRTQLAGKASKVMLKDFLEEYLDPYVDPVASRIVVIQVDSRPTIKLEGASVFRNNNMVGWFTEEETRGLLWIKDEISGSVRVVNCPDDGMPVSVEIKHGKTKIKSTINNGTPEFTIIATAYGKITEKSCTTEFNNPQAMEKLEKALAAEIQKDIQTAVVAAQRYDADCLQFGRVLHEDHKQEWQQMAPQWPELFKKAKVNIQVEVLIPEVSLLAKSLVPIESTKGN